MKCRGTSLEPRRPSSPELCPEVMGFISKAPPSLSHERVGAGGLCGQGLSLKSWGCMGHRPTLSFPAHWLRGLDQVRLRRASSVT